MVGTEISDHKVRATLEAAHREDRLRFAFQPVISATTGDAIEHSREVARRLRHDPRIKDRALSIVVVDEMGAEIHREPVHPTTPDVGLA